MVSSSTTPDLLPADVQNRGNRLYEPESYVYMEQAKIPVASNFFAKDNYHQEQQVVYENRPLSRVKSASGKEKRRASKKGKSSAKTSKQQRVNDPLY